MGLPGFVWLLLIAAFVIWLVFFRRKEGAQPAGVAAPAAQDGAAHDDVAALRGEIAAMRREIAALRQEAQSARANTDESAAKQK